MGLRRHIYRVVVAGLMASGCALLAPLTLVQGCVKEAPRPSAEEPIVIGVSLGLTGDLGSFTAPLRDAIRAAEGEINAGGGLLGRQVRFDVIDDRSDEGDFVIGTAQSLADRDVAAVIGPASSGQVKLTHGIFGARQILQLSPSATSVELTDLQLPADRFFFRTTPADDFQGAAIILFATKTPRGFGDAGAGGAVDGGPPATCERLALVYIDNPYGTSMAKVVADNFPKRGAPGQRSIVAEQKIPLEARATYDDVVPAILASEPECLAIISYEKAAAQFIKDFKKNSGYAALEQKGFFFIGTDGIFTQGFLSLSRRDPSDEASESTAEGVFGTNPDTQPGTTEYNAFKTIYGTYFPLGAADAPAFAANAFDAALLIAFAIQKAGSATDRVAIRDALKEVSKPGGRPISPAEINEGFAELRNGGDIDYKGASGAVDFQDNGNVLGGFIIWQAVRERPGEPIVYKTVTRFGIEELVEQVQ